MANNKIQQILDRLEITLTGTYENHFYKIILEDSNEYARMYTKLSKNAINTEFPSFGTNTSDSTIKITNYFELEEDNEKFMLFLIADFDQDEYYLKIGGV